MSPENGRGRPGGGALSKPVNADPAASITSAARWCEQHQRYECSSYRRYMSTYCHSRPAGATGTCRQHAVIPGGGARKLAHQQVSIAIREGTLIRPGRCELCQRGRGEYGPTWSLDAHHEDYDRPLDVLWFCRACPSASPRKVPRPARLHRLAASPATTAPSESPSASTSG